MSSTNAPTTRETADHAELARIAEQCRLKADKLGCDEWRAPALLKQASRGLETLLSEIAALRGERDRLRNAVSKSNDEICQSLGKALGYPWFKDDQANFPGSTETDGVCVGDHVAESIADEASRRLTQAERQRDELRKALEDHDQTSAECRIDGARPQRDTTAPCELCGATQRESCGRKGSAAYAFISTARTLLANQGADQ